MKKNIILISLFSVMLAMVILQCRNVKYGVKEGIIRGYVYTDVTDLKQKAEPVYLPDVTVTIKDQSGAILDEVKTKLDGSYRTKKIPTGTHKICLSKSGFNLNCYDVTVENVSNHPGPLKIDLKGREYIWGSVKLSDGTPGYYLQQVFGVDISTLVKVSTPAGSADARCNIYGFYVIPGVNPNNGGEVKAKCEQSQASRMLGSSNRIDLVFRNSNPQVAGIIAVDASGKTLHRAHTGQKIKLIADVKDREGNVLHYKWIPSGSVGFVTQDASSVEWQLSPVSGKFSMDMMVFDHYGGVAYEKFQIDAGEGAVDFAGVVSNMDGTGRIPGAIVKVNGAYAGITDAEGNFSFKVQENPQERYVLNVIKPGYALSSTIYSNSAVQKEYKLVRTTTETFDPARDINIIEKEDKYTKFRDNKDTRDPATVFIPANSIVDSTGALVTVPVKVSVRAVNLSNPNGQMPGNFGGQKGGKYVRLQSMGAVDVQVRDSADPDIKYNLATSAAARVGMPILTSLRTEARPDISFWDYNEETGLWDNIGKASKRGNSYMGITNSFSVLNADFEFTSGTYIVLQDNPSNSVFLHQPISIKVFLPLGTGGVQEGFHFLDNIQPGDVDNGEGVAIVNLPGNTVITVQIISNGVVINTLNPRTGPDIPGSVGCCPPPSPLPPYPPSVVQVKMLPDNLALSPDLLNRFLTGESNDSLNAVAYYRLIGASVYTTPENPTPHNITFAEWRAKNGYNADGSGDINAVYKNAGDLNFWRGMHKKTSGGFTSFYVSNFNNDNDARLNQNAGASVCMEYSPITSGINITKFYVFKNGELAVSAELDGNGEKFIPGLCLTCHGGEQPNFGGVQDYLGFTTSADLQAYFTTHPLEIPNFLPFDAKSFFYSTSTGFTRSAQEDTLRRLNHTVLTTMNRTRSIEDFIKASYNNNSGSSGQGYIDNAVVDVGGADSTWNTSVLINTVDPSRFYVDVVANSCRTCHMARTDPKLWFDSRKKFIAKKFSIENAACADFRFMPNSKVTFLNFWTSEAPYRPEELRKFLDLASCTAP